MFSFSIKNLITLINKVLNEVAINVLQGTDSCLLCAFEVLDIRTTVLGVLKTFAQVLSKILKGFKINQTINKISQEYT